MSECDLCGFPVGSDACNAKHFATRDLYEPPPAPVNPKRNDFIRGYYCAVSVFIRENGRNTVTDSLFRQGGKVKDILANADESDLATFRECGLLPETGVIPG